MSASSISRILVAGLLAVCGSVAALAQGEASFRYHLSDFNGKVPYSGARIRADRHHAEIYVAVGNEVRVFNDAGMQVFSFSGVDGLIRDLEVEPSGEILALTHVPGRGGSSTQAFLSRCNYRGEPIERIELSGLPAKFDGFLPDRMFLLDGRILLVGRHDLLAAIVDRAGRYETGYDLGELIGVDPDDRDVTKISGVTMDRRERLLFTVPVLFHAYALSLSPDSRVVTFGSPGSSPGQFGIVQGIAIDDRGRYLVSDRMRSVVIVFDPNYRFVMEFGYRGNRPGNLIGPAELAVGEDDKLYVTQLARRGISVFALPEDGGAIQ